MIYKLKHLQSVLAVTLCVVMSLAFAGCSKDEDGDKDNGKLGDTAKLPWMNFSDSAKNA